MARSGKRLSVRLLTSAQIRISRFGGLSPASGSALVARSLLRILSLPFSLPLPCSLALKMNKPKKNNNNVIEKERDKKEEGGH